MSAFKRLQQRRKPHQEIKRQTTNHGFTSRERKVREGEEGECLLFLALHIKPVVATAEMISRNMITLFPSLHPIPLFRRALLQIEEIGWLYVFPRAFLVKRQLRLESRHAIVTFPRPRTQTEAPFRKWFRKRLGFRVPLSYSVERGSGGY